MKRLGYNIVVGVLVVTSLVFSYFIIVNTILSTSVLPNLKVKNEEASLVNLGNDISVSDEFDNNLAVNFEGTEIKVPIAELGIKISDEKLAEYGKGADILKVVTEGLSLLTSPEVEGVLEFNLDAFLSRLPFQISDSRYAYITDNSIMNCESNSFNFPVNKDKLNSIFREALVDSTPANVTYDDLLQIPSQKNLLVLCKNYNDKLAIINKAFSKYLANSNLSSQLRYSLANEEGILEANDIVKLKNTLNQVKSFVDINTDEGLYEFHGDQIYLLAPYKQGRFMNVDETFNNLNSWLQSPSEDLPFSFSIRDPQILSYGKNIVDFTKKISSGKTRIDLVRNGVPNFVIQFTEYGLIEVQNLVVQPKQEFSFLNTIAPQANGLTKNGYPIAGGICNSTTTIFRAALEAGFPITERYYHTYNVPSYDWPYPINIVDSAYLTTPPVDLKFVNDLDYPILMRITFDRQKDFQYNTVDFYTNANAPTRVTELKNWKKWNEYGPGFFEASFDRIVYENGTMIREDQFYSRYFGMF